MEMKDKVMLAMIEYFKGDAKRIQHFTKVHSYAALIGKMEGLSEQQQNVLELAGLVHDIGIKKAEEKYGKNTGKLQEQEGPTEAKKLLLSLGGEKQAVERICYLVGHHHTYKDIDALDYQILVEADFLVNLYEDNEEKAVAKVVYQTIFKTKSGKKILEEMYGLS